MGKIKRKTKIFVMVLCFVFLITAFHICSYASSENNTAVLLNTNNVNVGDNVTATVVLNSSESMYAIECRIAYDSSVLEYLGGAAYGSNGSLHLVESPDGQTSLSYTLAFKALKSGVSNIEITSAAAAVLGQNGAVDINLSNSTATVSVNEAESWTYDKSTKTLTFSGEIVPDYTSAYTNVPWYQYKNEITTLVIKDGVRRIGDYSFSKMVSLKSVSLPQSLAEIGEGAFSDCKLLESINLPTNVLEIRDKTFYNCNNLKAVNFENIISIGDYAFYRCNGISKLELNSIIYIGNYSFSKCAAITEINFSKNLASIGECAFSECKRLLKAELPLGIGYCDNTAFEGSYKVNKLLGDLSGDSILNAVDVAKVRLALLGNITVSPLADVNNDCETDVRDLICLKKLIVNT